MTRSTLIAGVNTRTFLTIQGFRKNSSRRRLSNAPGSGEQEGMGNPVLGNSILEGLCDVPLANDFFEDLWSPLSG